MISFCNRGGVEPVRILWTGGWDSTFRIIELSRMQVTIEPVYVRDPGRESIGYETKAMDLIIRMLKERQETKAVFLPVRQIELADIPENKEITDAYEKAAADTGLGRQHEWLARLGMMIPGMELGTENGGVETSHIQMAIRKYASMKFQGTNGEIDCEKSSKEGVLLFGWFRFPIITRTEKDMERQIRQWGYEDIMKHIWFCHSPINGSPCGFCHPCHVKMESGMEWLLPREAEKNYKRQIKIEKFLGVRAASLYSRIIRTLRRKA